MVVPNYENDFFRCREISQQLAERVKKLREKLPNFTPGLAIIQVGNREDSNVYIRMKMKNAAAIGVNAFQMKLPNTTTQIEVRTEIIVIGTSRSGGRASSSCGRAPVS